MLDFIQQQYEAHQSGTLTIDGLFESFQPYNSDHSFLNLLYRMDWNPTTKKIGRPPHQFKADIKLRTSREALCMQLVLQDMEFRGYRCVCTDLGVDNTGGVVTQSKKIGNPDFHLEVYRGDCQMFSRPIDIKNSPVSNKATFKCDELRRAKAHNALILLLLGTGYNGVSPTSKWTLFGEKTIDSLLTLRQFNFKAFGGKKVVQIGPGREGSPVAFEELFQLYTPGVDGRFFVWNGFVDWKGI